MKRTILTLLAAAVTAATSSAATTILIDYNDGVPGGGHDAAVRNGGFETRTGTQYDQGSNWVNGTGTQTTDVYNTSPRTGTYAGTVSLASIPTNDTGHTIALGDVISLTFWAKNFSTNTTRDIVWSLGDFDSNTNLFTNFATTGTGTVTVPGSGSAFQMFSASKTVGAGDALNGQSLAVQFRRTVGDTNFPVIDAVTLSVVPEPSPAMLLGSFGALSLLRRRK